MANTMTGRIYKVRPTETREYNGKIFYERQLILDCTRYDQYTGEASYPNYPAFTFSGEERCAELDGYKYGDIVTVSFELNGVRYDDKDTREEKVFTKVRAFKIEYYTPKKSGPQPTNSTQTTSPVGQTPVEQGLADDMPF